MSKINCGSLCVKYLLEKYNYNEIQIDPNMIWISELAIFIKQNTVLNVVVHCYDSDLLNDYYLTNDLKFDGFKYLRKMIDMEIKLEEKKLTTNALNKELDKYKFMILCVESRILNKNNNMKGGHYIVLEKTNNHTIKISNPQKNKLKKIYLKDSEIINLCKNFGSWRILIKE